MRLKRILALVLSFAMVLSTMSFNVFAEETAYVAKVGDVECADASAMISALNSASGDVNVEIYGKIVTSGFGINNSNITKLSFVAASDDAEICVDGVSYIDIRYTNYPIEYTGLILSHINAGQNIDGFLPQYFSTYNGGNVTYTGCTFPNGVTACGSAAGTTYEFTDCIFNNTTSGLYSLWVYGNSTNVVVNGGEFCGVRGIKMYSEGSDDFSSLSVSGATFSDTITEKHAIVLTKGESITLTDNTFNNPKGTVQVDNDYASLIDGKIVTIDGTEYTVDSENLTLEESTPVAPDVIFTVGNVMTSQDATTLEEAIELTEYFYEMIGNVAILGAPVITLESDYEFTAPVVIDSEYPIIIDLNGHEMIYNSTTQGEAMITNKGDLTINDSSDPDTGVINYNYTGAADSTYSKGNYTISNGGTLTVNGGKITIANLRGHAKYPIDNNSTTGDAILVINGGHLYNYNTSAIRQFCNSSTNQNSVTINGGLIEGYCAIWVQNPSSTATANAVLSITNGEIKTTAAAYVNGESELKDVTSRIYCSTDGGAWSEDSAVSITGGIINENVNLEKNAPADLTIGDEATFNGYITTPEPDKEEVTNFEEFKNAINSAEPGATIVLGDDIKLTGKYVITKPVTIDGNGHSIIADETATWFTVSGKLNLKSYKTHLIGVNSDNVTLKDIVLDNNNNAAGINIYCAQNVVFDNVSIINATKGNAALTVNGSTLTVKNSFKALGNSIAIDIDNGSGVTSALGVTVEEGTVFDLDSKTVKFDSVATVDMSGAQTTDGKSYFVAKDNAYYYTQSQMGSRTTAYSNGLTLLSDVELSNDLKIKGTLNLNEKTLKIADGKNLKVEENLTITGNGAIDAKIILTNTGATVTGPENLDITTIDGYKIVYADGVYSAQKKETVAKIGEDTYESLSDAIAAAQPDDTIVLTANIEENVTINKNITLDGADKNYTGKITVSGNVKVTIQNVKFINGIIIHNGKSQQGNLIVKGCSFENGNDYAVTTAGIKSVTIEDCTVKNQSLLYAKSTTSEITVKNVEISGGNYVARILYNNTSYFENVTATAMTGYGIQTQNWGAKTITLKNCSFDTPNYNSIAISKKAEHVDTFVFQGENAMTSMYNGEYAKYVLSDLDTTLKAGEGYTVTAANEMHKVVYEGGTYKISKVAKIGENYYSSLESAFSDAKDGDTITLVADIELSTTIRNTKEITLDLNGKTITGKDETSKNFSLIDNGDKLTVTGNGKMTLTATIDSDWNRYSAVIANNPGGKLVIENGTFEHLGGTDMAYGIDNLTNGKGTYAETIINGGTIKSVYRGIRQFLNGVEAQNILTVNGGSVEGANKGIWAQSPNKNANTGKITIEENASVTGGVFLTATEGATEWPIEVKIASSAIDQITQNDHVPDTYVISLDNGYYGVVKIDIKGEGNEADPYLISNLIELEWFRNSVNKGTDYKGKFVKLTADIDLENNAWTPIGTSSAPFKGTFDGADKTISNLKVEGENNQGFFGYATEAKISNLILDNVSVKGTDCVGAVVGQGYASTYIDNCKVTGTIKIEGLTNVGGITGKYYARVTNSLVDGENVTGSYIKGTYKEADLEGDNIGGIMGHAGENNAHSNNTVKNITIEGTRKVGGLIGTTDRATDISGCVVENVIIKCSSTEEYAADNASTTTLGGLIGNYYGEGKGGTIYSSTVKDVVFEKGNATNVGAIVGGVRVAPEATEVEGVTVDDNIVVEAVTGTTNGLLVPAGTYQASADGIRYETIADAMSKAVAGSTVVIFEGDYEGGLNVNKSITVVGEGEVNFKGKLNVTANGATVKGLNFNNGGESAGYINAKDVLIEDCEVVGGNGFRSCYTGGTVTFKDSIITGSVYGIHFDGSKDGNIVIDNCEITGWTSFARAITKVTIKDTEFKTGNYNQLRFYQDAEITGTQFNPDMNVDFGTNDVECVIENCTVTDGSPVTDVIYLGDIAEMGVDVIIDNEPVKVPAYLTKDGEKEYYLSINDAIKAANGAGTVTLTEDTAENVTVNAPVDKFALLSSTESLVLDLNGKTLTGYIYVDYDATIEIKNGTVINYTTGKDTISSFGNITLTDINADGVRHIVRAKNGNVVINSGTYKYTGSENGTRHAVNIGDDEIDTNVATAVIYGGTFIGPKGTAADSGSAVLVQERSKVLVYGGEFSGGKLLTLSAQPDAVLDLRGGTYDQNPSQYVIEPAFAAYKNADGTYSVVADRSLELTASTDKLYEGEEVTIEVVVNGENIAGTSWTLNWNKNYFKPHADENLENTGSVNDSAWTEGHEVVFDDGTVVKKYTFVAIAQDVEVTGQFTIGNPCATTHIESFDGTEVKAGLVNETANVTILLKGYEYEKFFDNEDVTSVDTASADFDGDPHTFKIVPKDSELINSITYKVNDVEYNEVSLTEEGTYTITYKIDGKTGYADYEGTFTVVIDEADFVVEVNPYTDNTELVLVYTNTPKLRFKYDNAAMLNVKAARKDGKTYEYGNAEDDGYAYVYGYVVDIADISMITYTGDNAEVFAIDSAYVLAQIDEKFDFLADVNFSSTLNVQDIVTEYGVAYEHSALLANIKYQRNLLKADVDGNKVINNDDPTFVVGKVKTAMGLR